MVVLSFIAMAIVVLSALWLSGLLLLNDFSLPSQSIRRYKRVLVIFPHADDEAVHTGGLLARSSATPGCVTKLVILTKGERGTPDGHLEANLGAQREQEAQAAAQVYGVQEFTQEDFGDGQLAEKQLALKAYMDKLLGDFQPDLVVTYDLAGEYGHPDHIAASEVVTELIKTKYTKTALWYATLSPKTLRFSSMPTYMATDKNFIQRRCTPTMKVPNGWRVVQKVRGVYAHKSQRGSIRKEIPFRLPLWFVFSLAVYDYFYVAN
jgi:LmbE family N-acetylglucosaminyl deacetylase